MNQPRNNGEIRIHRYPSPRGWSRAFFTLATVIVILSGILFEEHPGLKRMLLIGGIALMALTLFTDCWIHCRENSRLQNQEIEPRWTNRKSLSLFALVIASLFLYIFGSGRTGALKWSLHVAAAAILIFTFHEFRLYFSSRSADDDLIAEPPDEAPRDEEDDAAPSEIHLVAI